MATPSLKYSRGSFCVLDQLLLPHQTVYVEIAGVEDAWQVIRSMQVRGAPLIAIVAVLGLAIEAAKAKDSLASADAAAEFLKEKMAHLRTSRPTAVNLFKATDAMAELVSVAAAEEGATAASVVDKYVEAAEAMLAEDVAANRAIGDFGADWLLQHTNKRQLKVLTICNTGSLATAGYGTALGVVRSLHAKGALEHVYACETRPYNQGARLTAFEIVSDGLPGTLICDSMASALMKLKNIDCVVVGADRVAANGDTANKIGTYQLAIAAQYHNIPFLVAAPTTTLDPTLPGGDAIVIEERAADELTVLNGVRIAPEDISVWNPAFDVAPGDLISSIVSEKGVIERTGSEGATFNIPDFLVAHGLIGDTTVVRAPVPKNYTKFEVETLGGYLLQQSKLVDILGTTDAAALAVREVGDGNMNLVFIVEGPAATIIVKQALTYVRVVGESWPLSMERAFFEHAALVEEARWCKDLVPEVFHFDKTNALIVMEYLAPPHIILRKGLIQGVRYPKFAEDVSNFMARTLFFTSSLHLTGPEMRKQVSWWSNNHSVCSLTEQVIFSDPYMDAPLNHWTTPQLDEFVKAVRADSTLKLAVGALKDKFLHYTQALIHGDLHTGSLMVTPDTTYMIDPEFAYYGPMGFDIGAMIANLLLAYFSQKGHANGAQYADWILEQVTAIWEMFHSKFVALWSEENLRGDSFKYAIYGDMITETQEEFMHKLFLDSCGFAGAKMMRRIAGVAHVEDLQSIADADVRSECEKRGMLLARYLMVQSQADRLHGITEVTSKAKELNDSSATAWPVNKA